MTMKNTRAINFPEDELKTALPVAPLPEKRYLSLFDSAGRKNVPMFSGLIAYFPDACAADR
jgi:hypothetical protein